ncbi:MAG: ABC transporter ATP-binding protein [Thermoleophilaceae bacterium]|nr:ABC transporter ATP-binding protein [Thermoleophilaceae bacterium]
MERAANAAPAVVVDSVSKTFRLPQERIHTLKERALHPFRRSRYEPLQALREVSFSVRRGEFFGIVGRNGSGKSTLLKCLAGIYRVDSGAIYIDGRVSTFIELGVGFNPDLPARDNIVLNGTMLGLSPKEARARADAVIDFGELREFEDLKLKNYSSGMQVRLAFSVMIQVDADVFLIDEVLAVGDAAFQQKCFDVFNRLRDEGRTILFVTHDMASVKRFCHRAVLLERGELKLIGDPGLIADNYVEVNFGRDVGADGERPGEGPRFGSGLAEIVEAWFEDADGAPQTALPQGGRCTYKMRVRFHEAVDGADLAVLFEDDRRHPLFATSTSDNGKERGYDAGQDVVFAVRFDNVFAPGRLYASPWVVRSGGTDLLDRRPRMISAVVTGTRSTGALVDLPHEVLVETRQPGAPEAVA